MTDLTVNSDSDLAEEQTPADENTLLPCPELPPDPRSVLQGAVAQERRCGASMTVIKPPIKSKKEEKETEVKEEAEEQTQEPSEETEEEQAKDSKQPRRLNLKGLVSRMRKELSDRIPSSIKNAYSTLVDLAFALRDAVVRFFERVAEKTGSSDGSEGSPQPVFATQGTTSPASSTSTTSSAAVSLILSAVHIELDSVDNARRIAADIIVTPLVDAQKKEEEERECFHDHGTIRPEIAHAIEAARSIDPAIANTPAADPGRYLFIQDIPGPDVLIAQILAEGRAYLANKAVKPLDA